jgi:hypothetical protein
MIRASPQNLWTQADAWDAIQTGKSIKGLAMAPSFFTSESFNPL